MNVLKRIILILGITLLSTYITGCQLDQANDIPENSMDEPAKNEVQEIHGMLENIERLNLFVENVQNKVKDRVRLTRYTIEGDPIFHDLHYDGTQLTVKYDTKEDKFGQGEVKTYVCSSIQKQESNTETKFILEECPDLRELLSISHDVDKEDLFAFELKYGVGLKNKIDTKNLELVKDLQNGETTVVKDFQFSKEEMNKIYKLMIFSNYLEEKKLSTKCNQKPYKSYQLTVWINGAQRHFEWSECDKSHVGKEMTEMVQNILTILKNNPTYQTLPEVNGTYE